MSLRRRNSITPIHRDLQIEDIPDSFFDNQDALRNQDQSLFTAAPIVGLAIAGLGIAGGALAAKRAIDAKKKRDAARKKRQEDEVKALEKKLEEIRNMKI